MPWYRRSWCGFMLATLLVVATGACGKQGLAAHVDELLRAGKVADAQAALAERLPALVRHRKLSETSKVADVLHEHLGSLSASDAASVRRSSFSGYLNGIGEDISELPWDNICESAVKAVPYRPSQSLTEYLQAAERRDNLANFCKVLGLL